MNNCEDKNHLIILDEPSPAAILEAIYIPVNKSAKTTGFVYALECGGYVKIGKTQKPDKRYSQIRQGAYCYGGVEVGRMAISARVKNYSEKEAELHAMFSRFRKAGTELFSIPFEVAASELARSGNESETTADEATAFFHFEDKIKLRKPLFGISKDAVATQVLSALLCHEFPERYSYTSVGALAYISGLSEGDVWQGLQALEIAGAVDAIRCGDKILVKHTF